MVQDDRALRMNEDDEECAPAAAGQRGDFIAKKLIEARTILIAQAVDKGLMEKVSARLLVMSHEDPSRPIDVYVNSPGGDADSGFAIYDMMKFVKAPVRTICAGLSASAAVIIYLGGDKGHRFCLPNSRFLIHQPSTYAQGQASDLEITAKEIIKMRNRYNAIVSAETGTPAEKIVKDASRDFWLSAEEAVTYGLVDKIVDAQGAMS